MVKIDVKDFFESISERQVYYVFKSLGYPKLLSFEFARICTRVIPPSGSGQPRLRDALPRWVNKRSKARVPYSSIGQVGHLPQGAPTSAMLANLSVFELDKKIQAIASTFNATYTRYADDIVLTRNEGTRQDCEEILRRVISEVRTSGLRVNSYKSGVRGPGARKIVTGLVINDDVPRVPKRYREDILLSIYHIKKHGLLSHMERRKARSPLGYLNHLVGRILFCRSVEAQFADAAMAELRLALAPYKELIAMAGTYGERPNGKKFDDLYRIIFN